MHVKNPPDGFSSGAKIYVTYAVVGAVIGLSCGLDLPHLGVLATAFGFALIFVMDRTITYHVQVTRAGDTCR